MTASTPTCDTCRVLKTEAWRLSQRLVALERRIAELTDRLELVEHDTGRCLDVIRTLRTRA